MTRPVIVVVGTDATMVYDALHNAVAVALGDLDPSFALQDFTAKDVASTSNESVASAILEALNTPPFLVAKRVVVVRDAQQLLADEVSALEAWMKNPAPDVELLVAVVGTKAHKLVKAAGEVITAGTAGNKRDDRVSFVSDKLKQYRVSADAQTVTRICDHFGDELERVDALARLLASMYGSAPVNFAHVEPYLGDVGNVPEWDLTDAVDRGDVAKAIVVARRMLDSRGRAGLQIVNMLQRHFLRMARLEGLGLRNGEAAGELLGINKFPAGKALEGAERLGPDRISDAVNMITQADLDLKGAVSYGGKSLETDQDLTDLTVVEVLVARLARLSQSARRR